MTACSSQALSGLNNATLHSHQHKAMLHSFVFLGTHRSCTPCLWSPARRLRLWRLRSTPHGPIRRCAFSCGVGLQMGKSRSWGQSISEVGSRNDGFRVKDSEPAKEPFFCSSHCFACYGTQGHTRKWKLRCEERACQGECSSCNCLCGLTLLELNIVVHRVWVVSALSCVISSTLLITLKSPQVFNAPFCPFLSVDKPCIVSKGHFYCFLFFLRPEN